MPALTERFQGLRRPGASLLKKNLPPRPEEQSIPRKAVVPPRKAVPPPKVTVEPVAAPAPVPPPVPNTSAVNSRRAPPPPPAPEHKNLPSLPTPPAPSSPPPASALPPTPSTSSTPSSSSVPSACSFPSPASTVTITPAPVSPPQQPTNQASRPPRTSSLKNPQANPPNPQQRPQNKLISHLQVTDSRQRPVSEAPSISQFIPDPEPEPEYPETEAAELVGNEFARGGRSESENSSDQTPASSLRNSDSNSNGSGISSSIFKQYPDGYIPPIPDTITIPPLTPVHYRCFQSHATMPAASNVWYATACMTCKKVDQEVRHRCTFCCMRICAPCYQSLQKCQNRSLNELMTKL